MEAEVEAAAEDVENGSETRSMQADDLIVGDDARLGRALGVEERDKAHVFTSIVSQRGVNRQRTWMSLFEALGAFGVFLGLFDLGLKLFEVSLSGLCGFDTCCGGIGNDLLIGD